jgi:hypothetical protein
MESSGNPNFIPLGAERETNPEQRVEFLGEQESQPRGPENSIVENTQTDDSANVKNTNTPVSVLNPMEIVRKEKSDKERFHDTEDEQTMKEMENEVVRLDVAMRATGNFYEGAKEISKLRDRYTNEGERSRIGAAIGGNSGPANVTPLFPSAAGSNQSKVVPLFPNADSGDVSSMKKAA